MADVLRFLGKHPSGNAHAYLSKRIIELGLDTSHFLGKRAGSVKNKGKGAKTAKDLLILNSPAFSAPQAEALRRCLFEIGREHKCEVCGLLPEWVDKKLVLQIDHRNGLKWDNTPENLRFICPNCHSQTPTFCTKNLGNLESVSFLIRKEAEKLEKENEIFLKEKRFCPDCGKRIHKDHEKCSVCRRKKPIAAPNRNKVSREQLVSVLGTMPMTSVGRLFGVSDNTIRQWVVFHKLEMPKTPRGYWQKVKAGVTGTNTSSIQT